MHMPQRLQFPAAADRSETIELELDGQRVPLQIRRRAATPSAHTERELTELHGWVTTPHADTHRWLSAILPRVPERGVRALDAQGEFAGSWQVSWNSYSESGGVHTHTLILRECEELNLDALLLGSLELHPYEYREEIVGGGLAIWAKMVGTREDVERLRALLDERTRIPVVRSGIHPAPRQMRLALAEWSEYEDRVKYRLALVEEGVDESAHPELARIERENSRAALGFYMNFAERLVERLVGRGLLLPEEVEAARQEARDLPTAARHDFWHVVQDIDEM